MISTTGLSTKYSYFLKGGNSVWNKVMHKIYFIDELQRSRKVVVLALWLLIQCLMMSFLWRLLVFKEKNSQFKILKNWCRKWGLWNPNCVLPKQIGFVSQERWNNGRHAFPSSNQFNHRLQGIRWKLRQFESKSQLPQLVCHHMNTMSDAPTNIH